MTAPTNPPRLSARSGKIAIIGANSSLGRRIVLALGSDAVPVARRPLSGAVSVPTVLVSDYADIPDEALGGCIAIVNCVGIATGNMEALTKVNVDIALAVLRAAERSGVNRLVHISSFSVYGRAEHIDSSTAELPAGDYGTSKLMADRALLSAPGTDVAILRFPAIIGKDVSSKLSQLFGLWRRVHLLPVARNAKRSMVSVDAAAAAAVALARAGGPVGGKWLLADPDPVDLYQLAQETPGMRKNGLRALPVPNVVSGMLRRLLPSVFDRIFGPSVLAPEANMFGSLGLSDRLDGEILRMIEQ